MQLLHWPLICDTLKSQTPFEKFSDVSETRSAGGYYLTDTPFAASVSGQIMVRVHQLQRVNWCQGLWYFIMVRFSISNI